MNEHNVNILSRKVDIIRLRLKRLQKYRLITVQEYLDNDEAQDVIERNLEIIIQAAVDINKAILKNLLGSSSTELKAMKNSESFILLARRGILSEPLARELAKSGGFRNVLAHLYDEIIPVKVIVALNETLQLYPEYLSEIQSYLDSFEN
jgi:uncharacterized protein YutE (UPF0331/DUF86 family)